MCRGAPNAASTSGVLAATCISTLVVNANTSAVSILLPAISADTGTSVETLQWAVTGYSLVGAAVIITSGSLGDVFGRRRIFLGGLLLFVISCVLIALAQSGGLVIAGRLIQGASGATILACGLSLLSVGTSGDEQLRAVSLWGAAAAVGAAAGPLLGGVLVDVTGWQGLFWIDAAVAAMCVALTLATVAESRDPGRPRSIDYAGTVLVALTLMPLILGVSKSGDWGWFSPATLGCFAVTVIAGLAFLRVEAHVSVPLLDLALLRNRVLVGSTIAILIGAGTINGLMYLLSLYFQDPATLGFSPLEAGLATLPATVGLVAVSPLIPRLTGGFGGRPVIAAGFVLMTVGFAVVGFTEESWRYAAFFLPLIAIAVGMGLANGPSSSAATAAVPPAQVGEASGVSNMARYVGAAVVTALAATVYGSVGANRRDDGASAASALSSGLSAASWVMVVISLLGVVMAVVVIVRLRPGEGHGTLEEVLAAAASAVHTVPPVAAMSAAAGPEEAGPGEAVPEGSRERGSGTAVPRMPPASPPGP
jgi:EmrB/QacA subfamily drug resistance transporter